ncbi:hypothetical protein GGI15_001069 [Coemansia interrupta]|uniref:Uncharacterized protein n=1 Tax=Coemansia interrupta TaxID=1126814 RepID=A0A9W8HRY6_9FUNG|nr:hypothetical protein GGI15_001069 [Coemansia interrupta]
MIEEDLRRMGISSGAPQTPNGHSAGVNRPPQTTQKQSYLAPRKKASAEALRKREQALEDEYDDDDGSTGGDIDSSLFPSTAKQMANMRRSEKYGAIGVTSSGQDTRTSSSSSLADSQLSQGRRIPRNASLGVNRRNSNTNALVNSESKKPPAAKAGVFHRLQRYNTLLSPRTPADTPPSATLPTFSNQNSTSRQQCRRSLREATPLGSAATGAGKTDGAESPSTKSKVLLRRRASDISIYSQQSSRANSVIHSPRSPQKPALHPLTPRPLHWRKCTNPSTHRPNADSTTTTTSKPSSENKTSNTLAANPILISNGNTRPMTARNASPLAAQVAADHMNMQRGPGSVPGSMRGGMQSISTTSSSSPAPQQSRPYMRDDGFDSSSDRLPMGGRGMPQHQQQQQQYPAQMQPPAGFHGDPRSMQMRSGSPFGHPPNNGRPGPSPAPGPMSGAPVYSNGGGRSGQIAGASNYSHSSSGDALAMPDPGMRPYAGMRPWTASSKSLPGVGGPGQFVDRDAPSSGASSAVGIPPMAAPPSARNAPTSSPPRPPPPTTASLEAYRSSIKRSNDPAAQLDFAKYVLEHARGISDQESNPNMREKRYAQLTAEGLKWVKKLAGSGITVHRSNIAAESQFFLGTVYSQGIYSVQRDDARAFSYYQQASKAQHAEANYRTAVCYEVGVGTRRDPTRALQFYRKAAAQSNVPAMYKLGVILIKGYLGLAANPREGITWLKRAADCATAECPHALHELALCHESSDIPGVIPDDAYARELYIKAGKLGYVPSQVRLGQAYEYGSLGCPVDPRRSIGWYTRAAEKSDPDAELALSGWYLTGAEPNLPQNDVEAYLWARRAADHGLAKAEYAVGYYYECGIGVARPDVQEAQKWYNKAAQKNNRRAIARLKELKQMGVHGGAAPSAHRPHRGKGGSMF